MTPLPGSSVDRVLTLSVPASLGLTLVSSILYATRGWEDGTAAVLHVFGGVLGALVVVRLVTYLESAPRLSAAALLVGMAGVGGVVGYGFNTIAVGHGGIDLIDETGAATILKPLGICWPLLLVLVGVALLRTRLIPVAIGAGIVLAAVAFPVARIGNIGWLAVAVDVVLLVCMVAITTPSVRRSPADVN